MRYSLSTGLASLILSLCIIGSSPAAEQGADKDTKRHLEHQRKHELLQQFDTNNDGKLDEAERSAAKAAHDKKHAAQMEQMKTEHPKLFAKIDSNNDGTISHEEMQTAREQKAKREQKHNDKDEHGERKQHADHDQHKKSGEHKHSKQK